jgi:hypothetical membrane protein
MEEKNDQFVSTAMDKSVDEVSPTQHGARILNWSLPRNAFWQVGVFRLVVIIGLLFYLLLTISMLLYPGGTKADPHTQGYSFFTNFLSDLGHTVAISGQSNIPSMVLFIMAMILAGIATVLFSLAFTQLFTLSPFTIRFSRLGALCGLIAGLCIIGVGVVPEDLSSWLHNFCIYAALVVFVAAYLLFFLAVVRTKGLPKRISWVYIALGVVLVVYTIISVWVTFFGPAPGTPEWVIIQATGQKIIVYVAVLGLLVESLLVPEVLRTGAYTHEPSTSPSRQATGEPSGGE